MTDEERWSMLAMIPASRDHQFTIDIEAVGRTWKIMSFNSYVWFFNPLKSWGIAVLFRPTTQGDRWPSIQSKVDWRMCSSFVMVSYFYQSKRNAHRIEERIIVSQNCKLDTENLEWLDTSKQIKAINGRWQKTEKCSTSSTSCPSS